MSASITPRESFTKRAVQSAAGGAPYDPDFVSNGSKAERIANIRESNARAAAAAADEAASASASATTAAEAPSASPAASSSSSPAAVEAGAVAIDSAAKAESAAVTHASAPADSPAAASSAAAVSAAAATRAPPAAAAAAAATPASASSASPSPSSSSSSASKSAASADGGRASGAGGGNGAEVLKVAAAVAAGVAVAGLAAYAVSSVAAYKRQAALTQALERSFADGDRCHLFVSPRTTISTHRSPACTEAETFLRMARVAYTVHFVEHGSDLTKALGRVSKDAQARIVRTWGDKTSAPATPAVASPTGVDGDRLGAEVQNDLSNLLEGGALPVMVYRDEVICVGSRAIINYCIDAFDIKLDAVYSQKDVALGVTIRKQVAYSIPLFLRRTLNDHVKVWAHVAGLTRGSLMPPVTGWCHVLYTRHCDMRTQTALSTRTVIGAMSRTQYEAAFLKDVMALEQTLGLKAFILGFTPSSYDCAVYAMLLPIMNLDEAMVSSLNTALAYVRASQPLKDYIARMSDLVFPDLATLLKNAPWMGRAGEEETYDYQVAQPATQARASSIGSPRQTVNARAAEASSPRSVSTPPASTTNNARAAPSASGKPSAIDDIDEL